MEWTMQSKLKHSLVDAMLGYRSPLRTWELGSEETFQSREKLLQFLGTPAAKSLLLDFLRGHDVPRDLANMLLEAFEIPVIVPAGAMRALELGDEDGHPLDYPVFWDRAHSEAEWCWRHNDKAIAAIKKSDGSWETQSATY